LDEGLMAKEQSSRCLKFENVKGEAESTKIAA
jgi:hypothetical protein